MQVELNIGEIEQGVAANLQPQEIEQFDDVCLFGDWAYLFKDDRLLVGVHYKLLTARIDA